MKKFIKSLFKRPTETDQFIQALHDRLQFEERPLQRYGILLQINLLKNN